MLIVQKFGGSSVSNRDKVFNVASRIINTANSNNKIVVVLSAQGDTTDYLIKKAKEYNCSPSKRELDMLLATGEQQSIALMTMAIQHLGYNAVSLLASQINMNTTSKHNNARIKSINTERIMYELEKNNIVIIAGFQGINIKNDITTLGRGGSDTTAVALASVLNADLCEIYTDVEGIYTADPRIVEDAVKLEKINYDEMLELASSGAKVLHNRSVELAKKYCVKLIVRSSFCSENGTYVGEESNMEKMLISGIAIDNNISKIVLYGIKNEPGKAFKIFSILGKSKICVDTISQSIKIDNTKDITFTIAKSDFDETIKIIDENKDTLGYESYDYNNKLAKLSVVGSGMVTNADIVLMLFEALYNAGVNIFLISKSEIRISVLIDENDVNVASNFVHNKLVTQTMILNE